MRRLTYFVAAACLSASIVIGGSAYGQEHQPLKLVKKFVLPSSVQGHFDHISISVSSNRVYSAAENAHQVLIFDLHTGKYLGSIDDIVKPHAILVRPHIHRLFITDGTRGQVRVYNSHTDKLVKAIPLKVDSDSITYNPQSRNLFVVNGGGDAHETYSMVSVINTSSEKKIADIRIDGDTLEAMAVDVNSNRLYINDPAKNAVVVVNRVTRRVEATWPVTLGQKNVAMALDAIHHRLFVACRSGELVVFNTRTGKEIKSMPIGRDVDDASFNPQTGRIYAQCGEPGATWVYKEESPNNYKMLGEVHEGYKAKNSAVIPSLHRYFVLVPPSGKASGHIDEFAIQ